MATYTAQPKKFMALCIIDILKKYSDADHRLNQKDIEDKLRTDYLMEVDRKSVKRNLVDLIDFGMNIEYDEIVRTVKNPRTGEKEENVIYTNFYLESDFSDSELRLLIDSLLFSKHIPAAQCEKIIFKLEGLSSIYFRTRVQHISKVPEDRTDNKQVFYNIEILDEAIRLGRKVSFKYLQYDTGKKQQKKLDDSGNERVYIISPYQMAAKDGKYYLICNYDKYDDISNYRIDRIADIQILDEKVKPFKSLTGADGKPLNLAAYMKEHVYMYSSASIRAKITLERRFVDDVIDLFGKDVRFIELPDGRVQATVRANRESVILFAKSFIPWVTVNEPEDVRTEIKKTIEEGLKIYT